MSDLIDREAARKCITGNKLRSKAIEELESLPAIQDERLEKARTRIQALHDTIAKGNSEEAVEVGECLGLRMALRILNDKEDT